MRLTLAERFIINTTMAVDRISKAEMLGAIEYGLIVIYQIRMDEKTILTA